MFENTVVTSFPVLLGRCRPISNPSSAFHGDSGSQQHGSGHAIVFPVTKQNLHINKQGSRDPSTPPPLSVSVSLSLSLSLSLSFFLFLFL